MKERCKAFTLIELLIVVAIIGILAAIAVPNFLNAQIRAKIARCVSDMKMLETSLEMYKMDQGDYPTWNKSRVSVINEAHPNEIRFYRMTTPVSYMAAVPRDPFTSEHGKDFANWGWAYDYVNSYFDKSGNSFHSQGWRHTWRLNSWGPDGVNDWGGQRSDTIGQACPNGVPRFQYQASNGLVSKGDIVWVGAKETRGSMQYCEISNSI